MILVGLYNVCSIVTIFEVKCKDGNIIFRLFSQQVKTRVKLEGEELEKYLEAEREKAKLEKLQEKIKAERYDSSTI